MINGDLVFALDWRKERDEPAGAYSYRVGDQWYVVRHGPGFSNTYRVTQFDAEGLALLLRDERKEKSRAAD